MSAVRHNVVTMRRVRELHEAGWGPDMIVKLMRQHFGVVVGRSSVCRWIYPEQEIKQRERTRRGNRRRLNQTLTGRMPGASRLTVDFRMIRMRALREQGLSHNAISKVMNFDFPTADPLDEQKVRYVLNTGRWPNKLEVLA